MPALVAVVITALVLVGWLYAGTRLDPYSKATLAITGDIQHGGQIFRINCAGCHGIAAQGLVGPSLQGLSTRRSDRAVIHQIVSGDTPPMPCFRLNRRGWPTC